MNNNLNLNSKIFDLLGILNISKVYKSNIGFVIISFKGDFVYKIYTKKFYFDKENTIYEILGNKDILVPKRKILGKVLGYYVLRLDNVRKDYKRKKMLNDLDLSKVAILLSKVHTQGMNGKYLILGDIHVSNFFEIKKGNNIELGIFDFSSSKYGAIEEDLASIYIELGIDDKLFKLFVDSYNIHIDLNKLYTLAIYELFERIKYGMNLSAEKKNIYYKFIIKLNKKL